MRMSAPPPVRTAPMMLDMADDTRLSFRFGAEPVAQLAKEINALLLAFKEITSSASAGKKVIADPLDYMYQDNSLRVSVECNPNLFANAFNAKAYVVVDDGNVRVASTANLTTLVENVKTFKASVST